MARRDPPIDPEGYYHVSSRGSYGRALFQDRDEHELFLRLYERTAAEFGWRTLAWTLLSNHHHFLIELTDGGLSKGMRILHSCFSRRMHAKYDQTGKGHLVRHGFYAGALSSAESVLAVARYIDLNPPRAGLCKRPEDWTWSSYPATLGLVHPRAFHQPTELLRLIGKTPRAGRSAYRRFVLAGLASNGHVESSEQGYETATAARVLESAA